MLTIYSQRVHANIGTQFGEKLLRKWLKRVDLPAMAKPHSHWVLRWKQRQRMRRCLAV